MGNIKYRKWESGLKVYSPKELADRLGISVNTVYTRFRSVQANRLWGVSLFKMPNGSFKKFVLEEDINKWLSPANFKGRPVKDIARGQDN